ncbi:eCIS core domain-containing protein [Streptomyces sp. NBC_00448]|uniref:eCIS core domain-containing protein n=1 Tax=Streptomyces sp. NBC_00448 TaxID=2903652 RepID=UPI003FA76DD0
MRAHDKVDEVSAAGRSRPSAPPRPAVAGPRPAPGTSAAGLLALQRAVGNSAVARMLQDDEHGHGHPHGAGCGHGPAVQRSAVHSVLRGSGRAPAAPLRAEMEARLGADFGDVRIHDDSAARRSAAELGARAYTSGHHVVVGDGGADKRTLAHELTHVIQQRTGPVAGTPTGDGLRVSDPGDAYERGGARRRAGDVGAGPGADRAGAGGHGPGRRARARVDRHPRHPAGRGPPPSRSCCGCWRTRLPSGRARRGWWAASTSTAVTRTAPTWSRPAAPVSCRRGSR